MNAGERKTSQGKQRRQMALNIGKAPSIYLRMKPTPEQEAILTATGRVMRINARAGTGKTTTLRLLAEQHPMSKILYLVFNRRAMQEAVKVFPAHVQVTTVHGLAFRYEGYKWKAQIGHVTTADFLPFFKRDKQVLAAATHAFTAFFLNAPYPRLEDALAGFGALQPPDKADYFKRHASQIVAASRQLASAWYRSQTTCPHDFYLKLFHKSGAFYRALDSYDMILVDEGQDLSPIMADALNRCRRRIVLVGDSHQQIYAFRYAVDAMQKMACDHDFTLSLSFRFGKTIARIVTTLIREAKHDPRFEVRGDPAKKGRIGFFSHLRCKLKPGTAVLSRTNLALFANAVALRTRGVPFSFERDIKGILWRTLDVYRLAEGQDDQVRDSFIASFDSIEQMRSYAEKTDDYPLLGIDRIVRRYGDEFPGIIFDMAERVEKAAKQKAAKQKTAKQKKAAKQTTDTSAAVVLSTVHAAKGQQYKTVYIDADIAEHLERATDGEALEPVIDQRRGEEINIAYVGITRVSKDLHLPVEMQTLLTPAWQRVMESHCARRRSKRTAKANSRKKAASPAQGSLRKEMKRFTVLDPTQPRRGRTVGDRVVTLLGSGVIVEIDGHECLVDLDDQPSRVWQPISNVREG